MPKEGSIDVTPSRSVPKTRPICGTQPGTLEGPSFSIQDRHVHFEGQYREGGGTEGCAAQAF